MARENKLGNPFAGLGLDSKEETILQAYLVKQKLSAKSYVRFLIRKDLEGKKLLKSV